MLKDLGKDQSIVLPLILASTSTYRSELLSQLGWPFQTVSPGVDEDKLKNIKRSPVDLALELSKLKAQAVSCRFPHACVIGSDQVCSFGTEIFDKPGTKEKAISQLMAMQGKTHELITAVTVLHPDGIESILNKTTLHMRSLSLEQVENYIDYDNPLDCAGSYKLESRGIKLFHKIETSDHTAIIGLPLIELTTVLLKLGYPA